MPKIELCNDCGEKFSFDNSGGFIDPIGQVFCENCDPEEQREGKN